MSDERASGAHRSSRIRPGQGRRVVERRCPSWVSLNDSSASIVRSTSWPTKSASLPPTIGTLDRTSPSISTTVASAPTGASRRVPLTLTGTPFAVTSHVPVRDPSGPGAFQWSRCSTSFIGERNRFANPGTVIGTLRRVRTVTSPAATTWSSTRTSRWPRASYLRTSTSGSVITVNTRSGDAGYVCDECTFMCPMVRRRRCAGSGHKVLRAGRRQ